MTLVKRLRNEPRGTDHNYKHEAANLIDELTGALRDLEAFVRELSEQGDHNALDMLERLRRGHIDRYERARTLLTKVEA